MATLTDQISLPGGIELRGRAAGAGRFLWHFLQMVIAMEAGMMIYHIFLAPALQQTAYGAWTDEYPMIGYWGMVVSMALGMLGLMLLQRVTGRYCFEMTTVMLAPVAVLTVLVVCSLVPAHILYATGDPAMFVAMAAYMLYRPHDHAHGAHHHVGLEQADWGVAGGQEESGEGESCHTIDKSSAVSIPPTQF